jgi:hypothetical protein
VADPSQAPAPKLDDAYWFSASEDLVGKSLGVHEAAASKLQNLVLWLWGVYTTYATVGLALSGKSLPLWATVLIALASAALIGVYWGTVWVQSPVNAIEFDPRSPDDIRHAFTSILEERDRRFKATLAGSVAAASLVVLALVVGSTVKPEPAEEPKLQAALADTAGGPQLSVLATVGKDALARVRVQPLPPATQPMVERALLATAQGLVQASIPLDASLQLVRISVEWEGKDGMTRSLSREVRKPPPAKR